MCIIFLIAVSLLSKLYFLLLCESIHNLLIKTSFMEYLAESLLYDECFKGGEKKLENKVFGVIPVLVSLKVTLFTYRQ